MVPLELRSKTAALQDTNISSPANGGAPSGATSALPFTPAAHEGTSPPGPPPRFQLPGALCGGALGGYFPQSTLCVIEVIIIAPKVVVNSFFFPLPKNRKNNTKKVFREVHNCEHLRGANFFRENALVFGGTSE